MMTDFDQVHFAMRVTPLLFASVLVAISAFALKRRAIFVGGVLGILLMSQIPQPVVRADYSSAEGAAMGVFNDACSHSICYGFTGACVGSIIAVCAVECGKRPRQKSNC